MQEQHSFFFFFESKNKSPKKKAKQLQTQSAPNIFNINDNKPRKLDKMRRKTFITNLSIKTETKKTDLQDLECNNPRTVFLDLSSFYKCWRSIPSDILFDAIILLPDIYTEWILTPSKYNNIPPNISKILSDDVFLNLLQWKHQQCLLFCMLNKQKTILSNTKNVAPFWNHFSQTLSELNDPLTYRTSNYKPLILNYKYYGNKLLYQSEYGVTSNQIISELQSMKTRSTKVISEILFQANPSLKIVTSYSDVINKIISPKECGNLFEEFKISEVKATTATCECASPFSPISPLMENGVDIDTLLDGIIDTLSVYESADVSDHKPEPVQKNNALLTDEVSYETDLEGNWWFAEEYEDYDGFQEIKHIRDGQDTV